jgi:hypothetical protein
MVAGRGHCARSRTFINLELTRTHLHIKEQDMNWLAQNWIWILFGVAFAAMRVFGHGGHGGHGGGHGSEQNGRGGASDAQPARTTEGADPAAPPASSGSHRHQG